MFCINKKDLGYIVTKYNDKFLITPDIHTSTSVFWRYDFIYVCLGKGRKNLIKDKKESIKYK